MTDTTSSAGSMLAKIEGRHRGDSGNAIRAAVLGANDGLVSNLSLVMGVAGAALNAHSILITGLAGLLAGACSMAMGEWLSVNTARESNQRQIDNEAAELEKEPNQEKKELARLFRSKGLPFDQACLVAGALIANKSAALDTLAREELGIDPDELGGSAWTAGATSFCLFTAGAIFPVAPFFFLAGTSAVIAALALSGVALFSIGAATSVFTDRTILFSGMRQLLIGLAASGVTYGIGHLIGVTVGG